MPTVDPLCRALYIDDPVTRAGGRQSVVAGQKSFLSIIKDLKGCDEDANARMDELDLKKLETRVEELIEAVERLQQENKSLRNNHNSLLAERNQLIEKTEQARTWVEAMIQRLKALENE